MPMLSDIYKNHYIIPMLSELLQIISICLKLISIMPICVCQGSQSVHDLYRGSATKHDVQSLRHPRTHEHRHVAVTAPGSVWARYYAYLFIYLSICLSVCVSIHLYIHPSIHLYPSVRPSIFLREIERERAREREMFYLTTHSTHFIYGYMASVIWLRTILIVRNETRCRHIGYSYRLTARVLLYAPSHRQDNTYHGWSEK